MGFELKFREQDEIGFITLSNPPRNELTHPVFAQRSRLESFLATPSLKAVILSGEGRHFCAGADIAQLTRQVNDEEFDLQKALGEGKHLLASLATATVPVLALIHGSCFGAGLEIALACHFRFAARSAMLGFPEANSGFLPGLSGTWTAPRCVGLGRATELILCGKIISADEAHSMGLVDRVAATKEVDGQAETFLRQLTHERSPEQIRAIMTALRNAFVLDEKEALREESRLFFELATRSIKTGKNL